MKIKNYFKMYLSWGNFAVKEHGTKKKKRGVHFFFREHEANP